MEHIMEEVMSDMFSNNNVGTKAEQIEATEIQYMDELHLLVKNIPEVDSVEAAQRMLRDMYSIEREKRVDYDPRGSLSREEVDGLNGRSENKKKVVAEIRDKMRDGI